MDQNRMQQRGKYPSNQHLRDEEVFNEGEFEDFDDFDNITPTRMPSSARRYQGSADVKTEAGRKRADAQPLSSRRNSYVINTGYQANVPLRRSATQVNMPAVQMDRQRIANTDGHARRGNDEWDTAKRRPHWLFFAGLAMLVMIVGWIALSALASWWQVTQDDWHYGRPRTFQTNAVVGHNDSSTSPSHFVALNLNRRIEIIEFPGGDPSKVKIFVGPMLIGQGQDLAAVTLSFMDVNGDGKPDMIVTVQDSRFVYINDSGGFRPVRPNEKVQI